MYLYSIFRHDESSFRIPCVNLGLASSSALLELLGESHGENFWTDKMIFRMKKWWCFLIFLLVSVGRWLDDWIRLKGFGISWELLVRFAVIWLPTGQNLILPSWTNPIYICWPMLIRTFTYPVWLLLDIDPSSYPNFWMSTDFARFPTKKWWIMMYHLSQMWIAVYIHGGWLLQPFFLQIKSSDTAPISPRQYSWEQWRIPSTHHAFFLKSELLSLLKLPWQILADPWHRVFFRLDTAFG